MGLPAPQHQEQGEEELCPSLQPWHCRAVGPVCVCVAVDGHSTGQPQQCPFLPSSQGRGCRLQAHEELWVCYSFTARVAPECAVQHLPHLPGYPLNPEWGQESDICQALLQLRATEEGAG